MQRRHLRPWRPADQASVLVSPILICKLDGFVICVYLESGPPVLLPLLGTVSLGQAGLLAEWDLAVGGQQAPQGCCIGPLGGDFWAGMIVAPACCKAGGAKAIGLMGQGLQLHAAVCRRWLLVRQCSMLRRRGHCRQRCVCWSVGVVRAAKAEGVAVLHA